MFFVLAKILGFFALPSNLLISLGLARHHVDGDALRARWPEAGGREPDPDCDRGILAARQCADPAARGALPGLRFSRDASRGAPAGIVCLGGALDTVVSPERGEVALNEAAERMTAVAELARRYPQARIVFTGGSGRLVYGGTTTEAELAARLFASFGIAKERITLEDKSRDTLENARFTKELVNPKPGERWLLVTSAHHMPRSVGLFRAERLSGRGVSGRLPHARRGRSVAPVLAAERRPAPHRYRDARVGRARRLPPHRADRGAVSRALNCQIERPCYFFGMSELAKGDRTRARILDEAVDLASVQGLGGLTIGPLAERLGLSKSGLFAHFQSKEALQLETLDRAAERFRAEVTEPLRAIEDRSARLRVFFERWIAWLDQSGLSGGLPDPRRGHRVRRRAGAGPRCGCRTPRLNCSG